MIDQDQDSLREEERRMRRGPYPIQGQLPSFDRKAEFSSTRLLGLALIALILIGVAVFLLLPGLSR